MKTIHKVKIDLLTPGLHPRVYAVQDDICTREVQISLYSGGVSWTPTSGAGVAVGYRKSDGTVGIYDTLPDGSSAVSISGNVVTVILAAQMLTAAGTVEAAVTLAEKSGNQITTFAFDVIVSANPGSGAIKSEDYFNYVNPKIQAVIEQAAAATTAANTAASRANASAELAEGAYDLADTANQKVDTLREVVSKLHSNIVETASGEVITVSDSAEAPLQGLKVFGKTTQNGTPTPDAPVALESVGDGGTVSVTVAGKNLLNPDKKSQTETTVFYGRDTQGIQLIAGVTYTFSFRSSEDSNGVSFRRKSDFYVLKGEGGKVCSYTPDADIVVCIGCYFQSGVPSDFTDAQLEIGTTATAYEPYKQPQTMTVQTSNGLHGIPVSSGGNYTDPVTKQQWICDEVDFEKGVYVQRVGREVFDGSADETWSYNNAGVVNQYFIKPKTTSKTGITVLNSSFKSVNMNVEDNNSFISAGGLLNCFTATVNTLDEWRTYLTGKPMTVVYELAEENRIPLSEEELAQYAALRTNYPNTTVFNDAGAHMEVSYIADTQKYVDKKFEALEAAIASLI